MCPTDYHPMVLTKYNQCHRCKLSLIQLRQTNPIRLYILIKHLHLNNVWLGVDLKMDTETYHMFKVDWTTCSKFHNCSRFKNQHYDQSMPHFTICNFHFDNELSIHASSHRLWGQRIHAWFGVVNCLTLTMSFVSKGMFVSILKPLALLYVYVLENWPMTALVIWVISCLHQITLATLWGWGQVLHSLPTAQIMWSLTYTNRAILFTKPLPASPLCVASNLDIR